MANCINLEDFIIEQVEVNLKNNIKELKDGINTKKPYLFDLHKISMPMFYSLLTGKSYDVVTDEKGNAIGDTFKHVLGLVNNSNVETRLLDLLDMKKGKKNKLFADIVGDVGSNPTEAEAKKAGREMQMRGIALMHVIKAMASEANVQGNLGVDPTSAEGLSLISADGVRTVSTIGTASAIGQDIAKAIGFKASMSPEINLRFYNKIGMEALRNLEQAGIVTVNENGKILKNGYLNEDYGKYEGDALVIDGTNVSLNIKELVGGSNEDIALINKIYEDNKSLMDPAGKNTKYDPIYQMEQAARHISTLSLPSNEMGPGLSPTTEVREKQIKLDDRAKNILSNMQSKPMVLNQKFGKIFLAMQERVKELKKAASTSGSYNFNAITKEFFGDDAEALHMVFGAIEPGYTEDSKSQVIGKSITNSNSLKAMIEMADQYFNEDGSTKALYFDTEMYRTTRVGYMQTILNGQSDKFFSRFALQNEPYELPVNEGKEHSKQFIHLLNDMKDNSGLDVEDMMTAGENEALDTLMDMYAEAFKDGSTVKDQTEFIKSLAYNSISTLDEYSQVTTFNFPSMKGSVWQKLGILEAIQDVRNGMESGSISTGYSTKPDATGSGIVLQLFQAMNPDLTNDGAAKLIEDLGLTAGKDAKYDDVYDILKQAIAGQKVSQNKDIMNARAEVLNLVEWGFIPSMREAMKMPTMITSYQAGKASVVSESAQADVDWIIQALGSNDRAHFNAKKLEGDSRSDEDKFKNKAGDIDNGFDAIVEIIKNTDENFYNANKASMKNPKSLSRVNGLSSVLKRHFIKTTGEYKYQKISESLTNKATKLFTDTIRDQYRTLQRNLTSLNEERESNTQITAKILPPNIVLSMNIEDNNTDPKKSNKSLYKDGKRLTYDELLNKFGMHITSARGVIPADGGIVMMRETPNELTALVNVIHSIDSAIMFRAHEKTVEYFEMIAGDKTGKYSTQEKVRAEAALASGSIEVHDANNGSAVYNADFQDQYRKAVTEVSSVYDMKEQMALANLSIVKQMGTDAQIKEAQDLVDAAAINREKRAAKLAKYEMNSERIFGHSNTLDTRKTPKKKVVKKDVEPTEELVPDDTEFVNPFAGGQVTYGPKKLKELNLMDVKDKSPIISNYLEAIGADETIPTVSQFIETTTAGEDSHYSVLTGNIQLAERHLNLPIKNALKIIEHEIIHANTSIFMRSNRNDKNVKDMNKVLTYLSRRAKLGEDKAFIKAISKYEKVDSDTLPGVSVAERIMYALHNEDEFVAVLMAEPDAHEALMNILENDTTLPSWVPEFFRRAFNYIKTKVEANTGFKPEDIKTILKNINKQGSLFIKEQAKEISRAQDLAQKGLRDKKSKIVLGATDDATPGIGDTTIEDEIRAHQPTRAARQSLEDALSYTHKIAQNKGAYRTPVWDDLFTVANSRGRDLISNLFLDTGEKVAESAIKKTDQYLYDTFDAYSGVRDSIVAYWDQDKHFSQLKTFLNASRTGDREAMNELTTLAQKATQERGTIMNRSITKMKNMMKDYDDKTVAKIDSIFASAPFFHLINADSDASGLISGSKTVDELITKYERVLNNGTRIGQAQNLANMLVNPEGEGYTPARYDLYNTLNTGLTENKTKAMQALVSLYAIKNVKGHEAIFKKVNENTELKRELMVTSSQLQKLDHHVFGVVNPEDKHTVRENLVGDIYDKNMDIFPVTRNQLRSGEYKAEHGWKILRKPGTDTLGLVYREAQDKTVQEGAGTTVTYHTTDVILNKDIKPGQYKEVMSGDFGNDSSNRGKIILTDAEKNTLGVVRNPADSMFRAIARLQEISDTQAGRDFLLRDKYLKKLTSKKDIERFDKELGETKIEDVKWMIKLPEGMFISDITKDDYPNIFKFYQSTERMTSIGKFNTNMDMVRTDLAPQLEGYTDPVIFENDARLRKAAYAVRQIVKMTKIAWVIINPAKIAADAISNVAVLLGNDVPMRKILKYSLETTRQLKHFQDLRLKQIDATVAGDNKAAARLEKIIKAHPLAILLNNGMMQSINVEIMTRDESVVSGVQTDIEEIMNKIFKNKKGENTGLAKAINAFAVTGINIDDILIWAGESTKNVKYLELMGEGLESSGNQLKSVKEKEDAAKYVSEFLATPGSQAVKLGSAAVQMTDIIPRAILIRHVIEEGGTEQEAVSRALDSFIDYKVNMPKHLKVLSDYGVILFPSFWMRIQRVIMSMATHKPASIAAALGLEEALMIDVPTIFDANVLGKAADGNIVGAPPLNEFFWFM